MMIPTPRRIECTCGFPNSFGHVCAIHGQKPQPSQPIPPFGHHPGADKTTEQVAAEKLLAVSAENAYNKGFVDGYHVGAGKDRRG